MTFNKTSLLNTIGNISKINKKGPLTYVTRSVYWYKSLNNSANRVTINVILTYKLALFSAVLFSRSILIIKGLISNIW